MYRYLKTYINEKLNFVFLEVAADLCGQKYTRSGAEFTVLFVQFALKDEFLEVDERRGHSGLLKPAHVVCQLSYLPFQAALTHANTQ